MADNRFGGVVLKPRRIGSVDTRNPGYSRVGKAG